MSARIVEFRQPHGAKTERETIEESIRQAFAQQFERRMSDDLATLIANELMKCERRAQ